jgi:predicted nucleic acid-binding protein
MRFWDSSAIVPLVCREVQSARCRTWLRADRVVLVWALAATEVVSALARKRRERGLSHARFLTAKRRLALLEHGWNEVAHLDAVRMRARRLLESHALTAADALHLGAALVALEENPLHTQFVTFDARLAEAAEREGFQVLGATGRAP